MSQEFGSIAETTGFFSQQYCLPLLIGGAAVPSMLPESLFKQGLTYQPGHGGTVRQHAYFTEAAQSRTGVVARRILALVLDQISPGDLCLRPCFQVEVSSLVEPQQLPDAYAAVKGAVKELAGLMLRLRRLKGRGWVVHPLLDPALPKAVGYARGVVTLVLNPQLAGYLLNLTSFTSYQVDNYLRLSSWYTMRLYELLSGAPPDGSWEVSVEDYRRLMDCELDSSRQVGQLPGAGKGGKYPRASDLLQYTVRNPLAELEALAIMLVKCELLSDSKAPGRKPLQGLRFTVLMTLPVPQPDPVRDKFPTLGCWPFVIFPTTDPPF